MFVKKEKSLLLKSTKKIKNYELVLKSIKTVR